MAQQCILMIHGRSTKPARRDNAALERRALLAGLERADPEKAAKVRSGAVNLESVYYGDITNALLAKDSEAARRTLAGKDPAFDDAPCLPCDSILEAMDLLDSHPRFDKPTYRKILKDYRDWRFMDEAAQILSAVSTITTGARLVMKGMTIANADMGAYLTRQKVGSAIRHRLQKPLKRALMRGDDICLIAHSMGCMVAYDVLWKFSRTNEYAALRETGNIVNRWITLGCPLGENGVKANLYDAGQHSWRGGTDKHPEKIIRTWHNVAAVDDYIAHDATMRGDFRLMKRYGFLDEIRDRSIYNCYVESGTSNPHNMYGYLVNPAFGKLVTDWIK
jgi:hypothetical protein